MTSPPTPPTPPTNPEHPSDEDLLADAIPIDLSGEDDDASDPNDASSAYGDDELAPIDMASDEDRIKNAKLIRSSEGRKPHEDHWTRTPNLTGKGAIHVKTFVSKLRLDAIDHLDEQVNEWLDLHPEYEVKFVTTTVGKLVGKIPEQAIFMNVWV
ncbi:MAG: hypothetical protein AAF797_06275 [Planctomycetota bacterium]